jgi:hypothetical protein
MLQKQTIDVPLGVGIQTKADPKVVQPGSMLVVENGEFDESGAVSKRNGYSELGTSKTSGGSVSAGVAFAKRRDELLMMDGTSLYTRTSAGWANKGDLRTMSVKTTRLGGTTTSVSKLDTAIANSIQVITWLASTSTKYTVIDLTTGAEILSNQTLGGSTLTGPRIIASGNYIYVVQVETNDLKVYYLETTSPTAFSTALTLAVNAGGGRAFDVGSLGSGTAVCAYETTTPDVRVIKFNSSGTTAGPTTVAEDPASTIGLVVSAASDIYVAYRQAATNNVRCFALTSALASKFAAVTMETDSTVNQLCGVEQSTNSVLWLYNATATSATSVTYHRIRKSVISSAGAVSGTGIFKRSVRLLGYPFVYGGAVYAPAYYDSPASGAISSDGFESYYILDSSGDPVARFLSGYGVNRELSGSSALNPAHTSTYGSTSVILPVPARYAQQLLLDTTTSFVSPVSVDLDFSARPPSAELGENAYIAAGQLYEYDGANVVEAGYHVAPQIVATADSAAGGSLSDGTYSVAVVFAWWDAHGQIHYSAPSTTTDVTVNGGGAVQSFTVTVPYLHLTAKSTVYALLYVVSASGGATLYEAVTQGNDTSTDDFQFTVTSLSGLTDNRIIYTNGGILENGPPPPFTSIVRKGRRLYGITPEGTVWYSKEHVDGEGAAFVTETFVKQLHQDRGDYYALAVMDDNLIALGENTIQLLSGEGLNDTGTSDTLSEPRTIATDVGVSDGTPVVTGPDGLYFKSPRGIYRLNRALQVEYIGAPVEDYSTLATVSAVLVPSKNQIRFGHSDGGALVYDYFSDQWAVFTNHTQVDAAYWGTTYCLLTSAGSVWQQSTGFEDPSSTAITLTLQTPWIKLSGLQGFQRLWYASVLGEFRSAHTLTVTPYLDYGSTAETARSLASTGTSGDLLQFRLHLGKKCQAVKFKIVDSAQSGTKESCTLTVLSLELGMKAGSYKLASAKTV